VEGNSNVLFEVLSWRLPEGTDTNRDKLNQDSWWHPGRDWSKHLPKTSPGHTSITICAIMEIKTRQKATMRNFSNNSWQRRQVSNRPLRLSIRCPYGVVDWLINGFYVDVSRRNGHGNQSALIRIRHLHYRGTVKKVEKAVITVKEKMTSVNPWAIYPARTSITVLIMCKCKILYVMLN